MSCCEEPPRNRLSELVHPSWEGRAVLVRYVGARAVSVMGIGTGRRYSFSAAAREQPVELRDAAGFLRSASFRVVGVVPLDSSSGDGRSAARLAPAGEE